MSVSNDPGFGPQPRRLAILEIQLDFFVNTLKAENGDWRTFRISGNAVPDDARVVNCETPARYNGRRDVVQIVIESETFAEVKPGELVPILSPVVFEARPNESFEHPTANKCPACGGKTFLDESYKQRFIRCTACAWAKEIMS